MQQLTGNNIRKGLDLEVSIEDIFLPDSTNTGDIRAKHFFDTPELKNDKKFISEISRYELLEFNQFLTHSVIGKFLNVASYNLYSLTNSKFSKERFNCSCTTDLVFYNTKKLTFEDFCFNFMTAQAFTGNFRNPIFQEFTGIGDFDIESAASIFPLAIAGNLSLDYFFIYYKGVLTSIQKIISAQFEDDIIEQKSYLGYKNYMDLRKEIKIQKEAIAEILNKF